MAWKGESRRHSLARKGIKTAKSIMVASGKKKPKKDWGSQEYREYVNKKIQEQIDKDMKVYFIDAFYEQSVGFYGLAKSKRGMKQKIGKEDVMNHAMELDWNRGALISYNIEEEIDFADLDRKTQIEILESELII